MCGIAGFVQKSYAPSLSADILQGFSDRISHRGPDHTGYCLWDGLGEFQVGDQPGKLAESVSNVCAGLMHRRLSILDTSPDGHQPMQSADGRYVIIQNGEIYNFIELRVELEKHGHQFRSQSDTEVLLAAFIQWGEKAFSKMIGMFALCLVDRFKRTVLLARDFYGIKPLFYTMDEGGLSFASEIKAFKAIPSMKFKPDLQSVRDYLAMGLSNHSERSFYEGIQSLLPGHCLKLSLDNPAVVSLSSFISEKPNRLRESDIGYDEAAAELKTRFMRSVELHMRSDVTYGALLSGGVDSSAIVAAMREIGGDSLDLQTFTYAARGEVCDEEQFADLMINHTNANATKIFLSAKEVSANIDNILHYQDEPFGSTSIFAQFNVFKTAADKGVKVLLDGQGADELLAGYTPYYTAAMAGFVQRGDYRKAWQLIANLRAQGRLSLVNFLSRTIVRLVPDFIGQMMHQKHSEGGVNDAVNWAWFKKQGIASDYSQTTGVAGNLSKALDRDFDALNLPGLLRYEDRSSMAHSLESRVPFLSPDLISFIHQLPESYLITTGGTDKAIFRHAMRGLVPDTILDRKDKIGFQTPEQTWFQELQNWVTPIIESDDFRSLPFIDADKANSHWKDVVENGKVFPRAIWRWINIAKWIGNN